MILESVLQAVPKYCPDKETRISKSHFSYMFSWLIYVFLNWIFILQIAHNTYIQKKFHLVLHFFPRFSLIIKVAK